MKKLKWFSLIAALPLLIAAVSIAPPEGGGGGAGNPGGSDTQMQWNNAGSFGGLSTFTVNSAGTLFQISSDWELQLTDGTDTLELNPNAVTTANVQALSFGVNSVLIWEIDTTGHLLPKIDSFSNIGSDTMRPLKIWADDIETDAITVTGSGGGKVELEETTGGNYVRLAAPGSITTDIELVLDVGAVVDGDMFYIDSLAAGVATVQTIAFPVEIGMAASDETTVITATTDKVTIRAPHAFTLTEVRCSLNVGQTAGSLFTVDVHESGTTVLSTKVTIDNNETTSTTAAAAEVISDSAIADDAEISIDVDTVGTGSPAGLKVWLIGTRAL